MIVHNFFLPSQEPTHAPPLRIQYSGATYHVMARGNRGEAIFRDKRDFQAFLDRLDVAGQRTGWEIRAFVLMGMLRRR